MTHEERHLRPRRGVWIASTCVAAYFGLSLVPHALPGLGGTGLSFAYVLSLPIVVLLLLAVGVWGGVGLLRAWVRGRPPRPRDRKSTRLNSSHSQISYAVFCLKKKNNQTHL